MKVALLDGPDMGGITRGKPKPEKESAERAVQNAHDAKVHATDSWVRGEMDSKKHAAVHKRADKIIKAKGKM